MEQHGGDHEETWKPTERTEELDEIYLPSRRVPKTNRENRVIKVVIKNVTERVCRFVIIIAGVGVDPVADTRKRSWR